MDAAALADRPEVSGLRDDEIFVVVACRDASRIARRHCETHHDVLSDVLPACHRQRNHCIGPSERPYSQTWARGSDVNDSWTLWQVGGTSMY